ncbi:MAG: hypothetical protein IKJ24_05710 [Clostridia bacterium]|nr:hypothetical protein [Clostridia bacterium]
MKNYKTLFVLLAVFLMCIVLIACNNSSGNDNSDGVMTSGDNTEETIPVEETKDDGQKLSLPDGIDPENFYKFVEFSLAEGEPRQVVVDYMRKQANIEWIPANDIKLKDDLGSWGVDLTYVRGKTYHGMIYSNLNSSYHKFASELEASGGKFSSDATSWENIIGVGCCSAILNALQQVSNDVYGETANFVPNGKSTCRAIKLGDYKVKDGCIQTDEIVAENDDQTMYRAYAQLDVGDIIVKRVNGAPHIRMVTEKATVLNTGNKVNPGRSCVKCIEQTNAFDKSRTDGKLTTWREDKVYTFYDLYTKNYLPVTLGFYENPETELPYLALDKEITPSILEKKSLNGTVSSNYPLKHVYLNVYNADGKIVNQVVVGGMDDAFKVNLRNKASGVFEGLAAGKYTFVIDAGIALGSSELCRVEFNLF